MGLGKHQQRRGVGLRTALLFGHSRDATLGCASSAQRDTRSTANAERQVVRRQGAADAGECRVRMVAHGRGTDGEVGKAGVRRVQRELDGSVAKRFSQHIANASSRRRDRADQPGLFAVSLENAEGLFGR